MAESAVVPLLIFRHCPRSTVHLKELPMPFNHVSRIDDRVPIRNAIVSVYDKGGLEELALGLVGACPGIRIYSTGGTWAALRGILGRAAEGTLVSMEDYTGQPEMKGGLVKTLDWKIYLGLLAEPWDPDHAADLARLGAVAFDLVVGNLYPFERRVRGSGTLRGQAAERGHRRALHAPGGGQELPAGRRGLRSPATTPAVLEELRRSGGGLCLRRPGRAWPARSSRPPPATTRP
ncbi:MAG: hypothetical protein MZV70_05935 [Desulfobacterales bacterium]|nr:hypothetical protein [Desulfobacterales bacterium]